MRKENRYIEFEDHFKIELYKPDSNIIIDFVLISKEDVNKAKKIFWTKSPYGYARGYDRIIKRTVLLHKFIFDNDNNYLLDHKDLNKLNCRRDNIRLASKQINSINRTVSSNSTTGVIGVSFDNNRQKYRAVIKLKGKQIFLGYHNTIEEATKAREKGEDKYFKPILNDLRPIDKLLKL